MNMHDLEEYRAMKDHHQRYGHLSKEDRQAKAEYHVRYGFLNSEDKQYHSPERPTPLEGEY